MNKHNAKPGRRGREARRAARREVSTEFIPYIKRQVPVLELAKAEVIEMIEANADTVLQEIGIEFRGDDEILKLWKDAGADLDGTRVRFPKGLVRSLIQTAPTEFIQFARNPERNVKIGGNATVFAPVYGPPFVRDLERGRRYGTIEDFRNFVKLAYLAPSIHHSGGTLCEPVDLPVNKRHYDMVYAHIRFSDKPFMGSVTHPSRAHDTIDMCQILFGKDFVDQNTVCTSLINVNSPLVFDETMLGALKAYAKANQAVIVSPFIMSGATGPVSPVGTLTQALAEAMAGIALTQLLRPGAPVIMGLFAASLSMKSGAPTFGTPEPSLITSAAAQLARRLRVPFRSGGNLCGSKLADAQSAYESANSMVSSFLSGVNFVLHSAGWLEGGLVSGYEKFIMDVDQLAMLQILSQGYEITLNGQAMDAIREVGPDSHYLGCSHTQANFETAFHQSPILDYNSFEQWESDGKKDLVDRANKEWKKQLENYEAPEIDYDIDCRLNEYIIKKKESFPDSNV